MQIQLVLLQPKIRLLHVSQLIAVCEILDHPPHSQTLALGSSRIARQLL